MTGWPEILNRFILQAHTGDLKYSAYPDSWSDLKMRVSFGMGAPARIPWIAFVAPEMQVSKGFYPVYLYYKEYKTLVLAYGVSETSEFSRTWPAEILSTAPTINVFFDKDVARYGDSFVFKAYTITIKNGNVEYISSDDEVATERDIESDLATLLDYYKKTVFVATKKDDSIIGEGLFYMEKQLEDFIIHNWDKTELGKRFDRIIEDGEMVSQQYRTDIGAIDILAKDKKTKSFVVIELKKNQSSDDTVGQVTRYMGWIMEKKGDKNVRGIIISAEPDRRLEYALKMVPNVELFIYRVDFTLSPFRQTQHELTAKSKS